MAEETTIKRSWYVTLLTPQTIVMFIGGIIALIVFWIRTKESWDKVKELERTLTTKADKADISPIKEQISRQYSTARESEAATNKRIDEVRDWMNFSKGQQSVKQ